MNSKSKGAIVFGALASGFPRAIKGMACYVHDVRFCHFESAILQQMYRFYYRKVVDAGI